jgi:Luciferase-like monooxygenase
MRIGIVTDERDKTLDELLVEARIAAQAGFNTFWMGQHYTWDPIIALTAIGREVPDIGLGTAIVPTYPLHPLVLAGQALSAQAAAGNRVTLGVGRAMLDREGVDGVEDVIIAGDESAVERQLRRLGDAGATEFAAAPIGSATEQARTIEMLAGLIRE